MKVAVLITVFNRVDKTLKCLESLFTSRIPDNLIYKVFLTDDGSTDGTRENIQAQFTNKNIDILAGTGNLYWNGGMNNSWQAAINEGGFDGYLWLNNDSIIYENLWEEILIADKYAIDNYNKRGIYVGSTKDSVTGKFSYGGFVFTNKWTLSDKFLPPNGNLQVCHAAHGNITYVSNEVVISEGIFCENYVHGGGDHDYSYLAYKHGFPVLVMRDYVGECENDHKGSDVDFMNLSLKERFAYVRAPLGYNLNNALLFQKRCFPYRYPFVWGLSYFKLLFPKMYYKVYRLIRN
ncbi:glycosyltransferase family 2 protein [Sphingobacterium composti Ten et al. 2007 non Yoo et al. 2007]|uniref:glycosyltransferase family 2 protein n=1 Tax=Sphingobacterium composti TaxID=363260 RepID=UPI0013569CFF|nr:glycosyltransferase [Sphingobacterium composti Ten et al. 2007 non Yoo et al. 2007]